MMIPCTEEKSITWDMEIASGETYAPGDMVAVIFQRIHLGPVSSGDRCTALTILDLLTA